MRIEEKIAREQSRYDSDLQEGLDAVSIIPSWSEVVVFRQSEYGFLVLDAVDHSIELTEVSKNLPDKRKEDDINIDVIKIKGIKISDNDNTQLKVVSMVDVEISSRNGSRKRQVIKKVLHEDRESPGVTGDQSSDEVVLAVYSARKKIE